MALTPPWRPYLLPWKIRAVSAWLLAQLPRLPGPLSGWALREAARALAGVGCWRPRGGFPVATRNVRELGRGVVARRGRAVEVQCLARREAQALVFVPLLPYRALGAPSCEQGFGGCLAGCRGLLYGVVSRVKSSAVAVMPLQAAVLFQQFPLGCGC